MSMCFYDLGSQGSYMSERGGVRDFGSDVLSDISGNTNFYRNTRKSQIWKN